MERGSGGSAADGNVSADILDKRKHFRSALGDAFLDADGLNEFDQWADAIEALDSYGKEGEANGVTVGIDTISGDSGAYTHVEPNNQVVVAIAPGSFTRKPSGDRGLTRATCGRCEKTVS